MRLGPHTQKSFAWTGLSKCAQWLICPPDKAVSYLAFLFFYVSAAGSPCRCANKTLYTFSTSEFSLQVQADAWEETDRDRIFLYCVYMRRDWVNTTPLSDNLFLHTPWEIKAHEGHLAARQSVLQYQQAVDCTQLLSWYGLEAGT